MNSSPSPRPAPSLRALQLAAVVLFLAGIGGIAFQLKYCVLDLDIWWHLKVGDWIVVHAAVPHTGILSRTAANRSWVAYSWGYEVLLSYAYAWFGLVGIGAFGTLLTIGVAYSIYWMLRRLSGNFWLALAGAGIVSSAFLFNGMPRPFFFSIAFFAITLTLLLEARRDGRIERLYWLPLIFCLWANLHIQFIYGLFLLGLFAGVSLLEHAARILRVRPGLVRTTAIPPAKVLLVCALCAAATLVGPNFYHPYEVVLAYSKAKFSYSIILELQPLTFRGYSHFAELFLAAAGFFAVGWQARFGEQAWREAAQAPGRRGLDLFQLGLLTAASVVAFRTMRDAWFICLPAAACLGEAFRAAAAEAMVDLAAESNETSTGSWRENFGIAATVAAVLALAASSLDFNTRGLDAAISASYPVNAINFLRHNPLPPPLYNNLNWGGFLMWYMPDYPVAVDGRNDLYGDDLDRLFYDSENAQDSYKADPYLNEAGVVLLDSHLPLAKVLTVDPRFRLVFHDDIATVFARSGP